MTGLSAPSDDADQVDDSGMTDEGEKDYHERLAEAAADCVMTAEEEAEYYADQAEQFQESDQDIEPPDGA